MVIFLWCNGYLINNEFRVFLVRRRDELKLSYVKFIIKEYIIQESNLFQLKGNQEFLRIFSSLKLLNLLQGSFQLCRRLNTHLLQLINNYVSKRENNQCKYKIYTIIHINFNTESKARKIYSNESWNIVDDSFQSFMLIQYLDQQNRIAKKKLKQKEGNFVVWNYSQMYIQIRQQNPAYLIGLMINHYNCYLNIIDRILNQQFETKIIVTGKANIIIDKLYIQLQFRNSNLRIYSVLLTNYKYQYSYNFVYIQNVLKEQQYNKGNRIILTSKEEEYQMGQHSIIIINLIFNDFQLLLQYGQHHIVIVVYLDQFFIENDCQHKNMKKEFKFLRVSQTQKSNSNYKIEKDNQDFQLFLLLLRILEVLIDLSFGTETILYKTESQK
ncbi:unnamed protein product (macronuclear) [Paramecium tetraurelia]|uniref:Uncharacterized protein n=1 Tax=Paramecium tetraurelia TaxID=5888 RepID=A0C0V7_PARTE|nr:uncharacterized protein GSPATT00033900001 [Paramecium tetraurelia]CAK64424.1 unnamed protein product [Paramecium tetraurelia]|eukprot:XP_001431822.1 hypothetical protein (macronuclear) [Paramecium tetraurelia strain d4-2]